ncbi:hypothetical protein RclHR1_16010002 [Rhizophagus clarus]|uniref:Uncharacterized protein n=1 Tax=Rhizophagus clarus TaxID=94130 RepID=A0A2Z6QGU9_9GLOM|nr:hypothetical protein RclHR1_16010002 [Rhizophagus clarus]
MIFFIFFLGCWTSGLRMLPAFLDEPDLKNVSCWPFWMNQTWKYKLPAFLDEPDLGYCWTPDLKCCSFPYSS